MSDQTTVLLLGGTGFVGTNLREVLEAAGHRVEVASRRTGVDLRDPLEASECVRRTMPGCLINCAAHVGSLNYVSEQAADVVHDNTLMALNIYRAVAEHAPGTLMINPLANCAYPGAATTFREDEWWDGHLHRSVLSYGATRRHLWALGECYQMQRDVRTVSLLVPNMYGPHDSEDPNKAHALNALTCKFVRARRNGSPVVVWGTGVAIREWLFAADLGRVIKRIVDDGGRMVGLAEPLNVAQNFGLSVRELVGILQDNVRGQAGRLIEVEWDTERPDGAPRKVMEDTRFRKVFPDFHFTPFETGLAETVEYYERRLAK